MAMERLIKIHEGWIGDEELLMKRLHQIISGTNNDTFPISRDHGYKWQLDSSNDWFAEIRNGELMIASRYGGDRYNTLIAFASSWLD